MAFRLDPDHLTDLEKSGLRDDTIRIMGTYSVCSADIPKLLGWNPEKIESALVLPYPGVDGFFRLKVFPGYKDNKGHTVKYLQPKDSSAHLYVLPSVRADLANPSVPLYFTEGEKKAAKAVQEGLACVGLGGLWNWIEKDTGKGINELDPIAWPDRKCIIVPDSDIWTRIELQRAVYALGKELERKGGKVSVVVIPPDGHGKVGLDDYLVKYSLTDFNQLKQLSLSHPTLKQHQKWWKKRSDKKKNQTRISPNVSEASHDLPHDVSLIQVHAAQQELTSSPHSGDFLELSLAVAVSLPIALRDGTPPVWLMGVGAPSSDKTETVMSLSQSPDVYLLDTLTENSFISGYLDSSGNPPQDLLAELGGQCLLVKDYTTLFSLKDEVIRRVIGDLQSIYDGAFSRFTGTRGRVAYNTLFSHIGCITPLALSNHHRYMAMIGGRFLFYRLNPLRENEREQGLKILWEDTRRKEKIQNFRRISSGFLHTLLNQTPPIIRETDKQKEEINGLAQLLAHGRAVITTKRGEYIKEGENKTVVYYEPEDVQIEEPFRAAMQLRTLGRSLAWIHGRDYLTEHDMELLRRVVLSTMPVDRASVLALFQEPERLTNEGALTRSLCCEGIERSYNRANQILTELYRLKILEMDRGKEEKSEPNVYKPLACFDRLLRKPIEPLDHITDLVEEIQQDIGGPKKSSQDEETSSLGGTPT